MAQILTSIHGRRLGISATGGVVDSLGRTALVSNDAGTVFGTQGTPGALNATGALTTALLLGGIVTSTTGAAVVATLDTGTVTGAALPDLPIGGSIEWSAINTGGNAFTVTAATDHTIVGAGAVAAGTSGRFRTRRTAATTFVTYRL